MLHAGLKNIDPGTVTRRSFLSATLSVPGCSFAPSWFRSLSDVIGPRDGVLLAWGDWLKPSWTRSLSDEELLVRARTAVMKGRRQFMLSEKDIADALKDFSRTVPADDGDGVPLDEFLQLAFTQNDPFARFVRKIVTRRLMELLLRWLSRNFVQHARQSHPPFHGTVFVRGKITTSPFPRLAMHKSVVELQQQPGTAKWSLPDAVVTHRTAQVYDGEVRTWIHGNNKRCGCARLWRGCRPVSSSCSAASGCLAA